MIAFACVGCGKSYHVNDALAGRRAKCTRCERVMHVPAAASAGEFDLEPEPVPPPIPYETPRLRPSFLKPRQFRPLKPLLWGGIERDGWIAIGIGLVVALAPLLVPLIGFMLFPLKSIIHELGHAVTAWLLGIPAIPTFDLIYGGGVTRSMGRQPILVVLEYAVLAYGLFLWRANRPVLIGLTVLAGLYTVALATPLGSLLILMMGHGSELLFAALFLYRALSGHQILSPVERPLYATLGIYFVLFDIRFAFGLMTDPDALIAYGQGKGAGHKMDFDRIGLILGLPIQTVAGVFLIACILTPVAAYLAHRYGEKIFPGQFAV